MKQFLVKATIHKMGRTCATCTTHFEVTVLAEAQAEAVDEAKRLSGHDPNTYQFRLTTVKEV